MKSFSKPTVPKHYNKASANKVLELIGSSKKMPLATISAAESYIQTGKFWHVRSSVWKYMSGIKVYLNYAKYFLHVVNFEGLTSDLKDETDTRKEADLHVQVHS